MWPRAPQLKALRGTMVAIMAMAVNRAGVCVRACARRLKQVEAVVKEKFGQQALRIVRLLAINSAMEQKQVRYSAVPPYGHGCAARRPRHACPKPHARMRSCPRRACTPQPPRCWAGC